MADNSSQQDDPIAGLRGGAEKARGGGIDMETTHQLVVIDESKRAGRLQTTNRRGGVVVMVEKGPCSGGKLRSEIRTITTRRRTAIDDDIDEESR